MENISATPHSSSIDKSKLVIEIGKLETELSQLEGKQREIERQLQSAKSSRTISGVVFVIFVLGSLIVNLNMGMFLFLLVVFIIVGISANRNFTKIQKELDEVENQIPKKRGQLAESRAQLTII